MTMMSMMMRRRRMRRTTLMRIWWEQRWRGWLWQLLWEQCHDVAYDIFVWRFKFGPQKTKTNKIMSLGVHIGHDVSHCSPSCGLKTLSRSRIITSTNYHESPWITTDHYRSSLPIITNYRSGYRSFIIIMTIMGMRGQPCTGQGTTRSKESGLNPWLWSIDVHPT